MSQKLTVNPICRAYFNRRDDPTGCWSVDTGPGTKEFVTKTIIARAFSTSKEDFSQHGLKAVSAWFEYRNVIVEETSESITIRAV